MPILIATLLVGILFLSDLWKSECECISCFFQIHYVAVVFHQGKQQDSFARQEAFIMFKHAPQLGNWVYSRLLALED